MIKSYEIYHGIAFARLVSLAPRPFSIETFSGENNCSYVVDGRVGLYIKLCSSRRSPWIFTFRKDHQHEVDALRNKFGQVFVLLVCHYDGVVGLSYEELKLLLDEQYDETEWIRVARRKREMYAVTGKNGALDCKVGEKDYPKKIFDYLDVKSSSTACA